MGRFPGWGNPRFIEGSLLNEIIILFLKYIVNILYDIIILVILNLLVPFDFLFTEREEDPDVKVKDDEM